MDIKKQELSDTQKKGNNQTNKKHSQPGMVAYTFNLSTQNTKAARSL